MTSHIKSRSENHAASSLRLLNREHILMIEEALESVGDYGEVRLVIEKGRLRFVVTQTSRDALRRSPVSK